MTDLHAIRAERLQRTLTAVAAAHPFYRARFRELTIEPADVRSLDDLESLPTTSKDDYILDPEAFRLRADDLPTEFGFEERVIWDIAYTTGTTSGKPSPFYNTTHDAYAIWDQARRCNEAEGVRPGDRVANLYPIADFPTGAFLSVVRSTMIAGLPVVHGLTGSARSEFKVRNSLHEAIAKVGALRPTVLWGVPSFIRRFLDEALVGEGAEFSDVRLVITSGEPMPPTLRAEIRDRLARLGAASVQIRARYAFTEMQGGLVQCAEEAAPQNVCPDLYYLEAVDEAGRRVPDGETGMLAVTHLHRRGTVLLRYLVGDLAALSREPCPLCGRAGERVVTPPRRTGSLVKCRGMLVNTDVVVETVSAMPNIGQFQLVFMRDASAMDRLVIRIEQGASDWAASDAATLGAEIARRVREAVSLRPEIEFVARGELYDHERSIKAKRVLDLREADG